MHKPTKPILLPDDVKIQKTKVDGQWKKYINIRENGRTLQCFLTKDETKYLKPQKNWCAQYSDYHNARKTISLCSDKESSQAALGELTTYIEKLRAGRSIPPVNEVSPMIREHVVRALQDAGQETTGDQLSRRPLTELVQMYADQLEAKGTTERYREYAKKYLEAVVNDCSFRFASDISLQPITTFINAKKQKVSARTTNAYSDQMRFFCNWCIEHNILKDNPLKTFKRLDERANRVREARPLTEKEVHKLLEAALHRPLATAKGKLADRTRQKLTRLGQDRQLAYALMVFTGLRVNEVRQLIWGDIVDDTITVRASIAKNSKKAVLPLHPYVAQLLSNGNALPSAKIVNIPSSNSSFHKVLMRDLEFAKIKHKDDCGKVVHLHAMRHTFCSLLANKGVPPHILHRLARHADMNTTMKFYTHLYHGDASNAINLLKAPKTRVSKTG